MLNKFYFRIGSTIKTMAKEYEKFSEKIQRHTFEGSDNFIYNSLTKQGMAYFADNGDLVVEIFDRQAGKSIKTTYKLQH